MGTDADRQTAAEERAAFSPEARSEGGEASSWCLALWDSQLWNPELPQRKCRYPEDIMLARPWVETTYREMPTGEGPQLGR